jgi:hypothetical protein
MSALRKFGTGFLYGAGFLLGVAVAAVIVLTLGVSIWSPQTGTRFALGSATSPDPQLRADQFEFSNTNTVKNNWGGVSILGTVHNKGRTTGQYFQINADLFDQSGKFIFQCMTQLRDGLAKDEQANFKIDCHDAPKDISEQVISFKVYARSQ